jgi:hypothetical protein
MNASNISMEARTHLLLRKSFIGVTPKGMVIASSLKKSVDERGDKGAFANHQQYPDQ